MINVAEQHFNIRIRKKNWCQVVLDLRTKNAHRYHVGHLCGLLGVTKQAYYKYDEKKVLSRIADEEFVIQFVSGAREHAPVLAERSYGICIVNILKGIDLSVETVLSIFSTSIISWYAIKSVNREQQIHVMDFRPNPIR